MKFYVHSSVTGISTEVSTAVIYFVCIFYSAIVRKKSLFITFLLSVPLSKDNCVVWLCMMQGGLKAVLWTDVFQSFIMLASLLIIAGKGLSDIGGFSIVWERVSEYGRLEVLKYVLKVGLSVMVYVYVLFSKCRWTNMWSNVNSFDPDLRTRHTIWTCIFAGYFFWLPPFAATQVQVQRFLSMPDMKTVKRLILH